MAIEDHGLRPEIISTDLSQIGYANPRLSNLVTNLQEAIDYIVNSMYPNFIASVATFAALPVSANDADYYLVQDDGDGKQAGYVWETRNGVSGFHKKFDVDWSLEGMLADLQNQIDPEYATLLGKAGGQILSGGNATLENLDLEANSFDDSGEIIVWNDVVPVVDLVKSLGSLSRRFTKVYTSSLDDGANQVTIAEAKEAYDHSQIVDANPHGLDYEDLETLIGNITFNGDVDDVVYDFKVSGDGVIALTIKDDSHNHTTSTITDFVDETWTLLKTRLQDSTTALWSFNDTTKEASVAITIDTSDITDIESPESNRILTGSADGTTWRKSDGLVELVGHISGSASYDSIADKTLITTTVENTPIETIDRIQLDNYTFASALGNPTIITATAHNLSNGSKVRIYGSTFDGEHVVTVIDANSFSVVANTIANETGHYIPNGSQLLFNTTTNVYEVRREFAGLSHYELADLGLDDHAQYNKIGGRTDGSTNIVTGGELANGDLTLQSTSWRASVGSILFRDKLAPEIGAVYNVGVWEGTDIGINSRPFRSLHLRGEVYGLRPERVTSLPTATITDEGRIVRMPNNTLWINKATKYQQLMEMPDLVGRKFKALVVNTSEDGFDFKDVEMISNDSQAGQETGIGTVSAVTITAPANAFGVLIQVSDENDGALRFSWGTDDPTINEGYKLLQGQTEKFLISSDLKVIAVEGVSNKLNYTWLIAN